MSDFVKLIGSDEFGQCCYELSNGHRLDCYLLPDINPPKSCTEEYLSSIIDWNELTQLHGSTATYCCEPLVKSIADFKLFLSNNDERVWKCSGLDLDSDSD